MFFTYITFYHSALRLSSRMLYKTKTKAWVWYWGNVFQRNARPKRAENCLKFSEKFSGGFLGGACLGLDFGRAYFLRDGWEDFLYIEKKGGLRKGRSCGKGRVEEREGLRKGEGRGEGESPRREFKGAFDRTTPADDHSPTAPLPNRTTATTAPQHDRKKNHKIVTNPS